MIVLYSFVVQCPEENGTPVTGYTLEWMEDGTFVEVRVLRLCIDLMQNG